MPLPLPESECDIAAQNEDLPDDEPTVAEEQPTPETEDESESDEDEETEEVDDDVVIQEGPDLFEADSPPGERADEASDDSPAQPVEPPLVRDSELQNVSAPAADRPAPDRPAAPLALYRRYRPDTFAEVIGQEHVTEPLCRAIANNKVNHAYLFSGPRGCGKTTSARILARCLNCAEGPTPTPCGECESCRALATGGPGSIDVIEIDAASHGRVDDARELREGVYFAPVASRYKIYIIDEAHMVTKEGFNALLKVVEEPPEHVKFIFATTEPEKVIGTIRSRTHHYPFRLVPPRTLTAYLEKICGEEGVDVERGVLPLVVRAGAGSVRDSLSVLDQLLGAADHGHVAYQQAAGLLGYTPDALLDEIVDAFAAGDGKGVFAAIDKVIEVGQDPRRFAEDLLERMRDLVIVAQVPDAIGSGLIDVADDQAERLQAQASALGAGELTRAAEVIATGLVQMRGTTAPRLHLELICARILLPTADDDSRGVHARLDRIERRLDMPDVVPGRPAAPVAAGSAQSTDGAGYLSRDSVSHVAAQAPAGQRPAGQRPAGQRPAQASGGEELQEQRHPDHAPIDHVPAPGGNQDEEMPVGQQSPAAPDRSGQEQGSGAAAGQGAVDSGSQQPSPAQQTERSDRAAASASSAHQAPASDGPSADYREHQQRTSQAPASGGPSTADLRRLWPQILEEVKSHKRFTHALLSQNAQVVEVRGSELLLGFANPGTLERFQSGGSIDVLRQSLIAVLGADLRISASVDGGPSSESRQGQHRAPAEPPPGYEPEPEPEQVVHHYQAARDNRRPTGDELSARTLNGAPARASEMSESVMSDIVTADDAILDESGGDAAELLKRQLGAQIIEEQEI
ncbi:DNA polymerase III subunit gamma and tau [Propionimicrobium sp. PCR01-08-3]|uniref:DNA polymerase III subunit gamma and tau n=1 Tax=Propionimicrobium sp. PCR01-08-3 TaxID=3052086 RepID=UPI00255C967F|nr:DNA polymerase III subunit gamma and tau [Propionimicrobium sp. PCR01-08-3]WIY84256.1 DNA polymerase III subunit gamma and tau [Propionimicrobium sp. PCR01-08-3]